MNFQMKKKIIDKGRHGKSKKDDKKVEQFAIKIKKKWWTEV